MPAAIRLRRVVRAGGVCSPLEHLDAVEECLAGVPERGAQGVRDGLEAVKKTVEESMGGSEKTVKRQ